MPAAAFGSQRKLPLKRSAHPVVMPASNTGGKKQQIRRADASRMSPDAEVGYVASQARTGVVRDRRIIAPRGRHSSTFAETHATSRPPPAKNQRFGSSLTRMQRITTAIQFNYFRRSGILSYFSQGHVFEEILAAWA